MILYSQLTARKIEDNYLINRSITYDIIFNKLYL